MCFLSNSGINLKSDIKGRNMSYNRFFFNNIRKRKEKKKCWIAAELGLYYPAYQTHTNEMASEQPYGLMPSSNLKILVFQILQ